MFRILRGDYNLFGKTLKFVLTLFSIFDFNIWRNNLNIWKNGNSGGNLDSLFEEIETEVECLTLEVII